MEWGILLPCLHTSAKRTLPNRIKIPKEPRKLRSHIKAVNLQGCLFLFCNFFLANQEKSSLLGKKFLKSSVY